MPCKQDFNNLSEASTLLSAPKINKRLLLNEINQTNKNLDF